MKSKSNLIYLVFLILASLILAGTMVYVGIKDITDNSANLGAPVMVFMLGFMILLGAAFLIVAEFSGNKEMKLLGTIFNHLAVMMVLFTQANNNFQGFGIMGGIALFVCSIFLILNLYLHQTGLQIVAFVFSAVTFLCLLGDGIYGLISKNYDLLYVLYFFGYFFFGAGLFVLGLFGLINLTKKNDVPQA
jgi:hypothetical protein